jgi:hypothetical protein
MFWAHVRRGFFYQNWSLKPFKIGDIPMPSDLSVWIRAFRARWLYPVLLLTDLDLVVGALANNLRLMIDPDDVADCLNLDAMLIQSHFIMPTPWSYFAKQIVRLRPLSYSVSTPNSVYAPWEWYHREHPDNPSLESPPIHDLAFPVLKKVFY